MQSFRASPDATPQQAIPVVTDVKAALAQPLKRDLRVTWLGRSTLLFEVDGTRILIGPVHRVYYSGDTGYFPGFKDIGSWLGPFDVTLIETGQYNPFWPDWHRGPEQAVRAHQDVRGEVMIGII